MSLRQRAGSSRGLWVTLAACLTLGCSSDAPPHTEPELGLDLPAQWSTGATTPQPVAASWWHNFDDAALSVLIEEALEHNHDLHAAAARVEAAVVQARLAGANVTPTLELQLGGSRQERNFIGFPIPGAGSKLSRTFTQFGVSLATSWELDLWGRIRAGHSAALADVQATTAQLAAAQQSLAAQTAKAYLAAIETNLQLALATQTERLFTDTLEQVRGRVVRGVAPLLDLPLARSNLAASQAALAAQRERQQRTQRQLELLLGRYPAGQVEAAAALPAVPATVPAGLPAELLRRRPDVIAAERRLAATNARADQARATLFPRLSLTASAGTATDAFADLLDSDLFVWGLAGNLVQPLVQQGRLRGEVALAEARIREAAAAYAHTALTAYTEVEAALGAEQLLRDQADRLRDAEQQAVAARELAEERYQNGIAVLLTVLESQRRAVLSARDRIGIERQILDNRVDLHLALGGSFGTENQAQ